MGVFTLLDDPLVDRTIESHLHRIVAAVTSRMQPEAIVLRGSFGRGEGSVMIQDGQLRFLSDYEVDVATFSPSYRSMFAALSDRLTEELGVESGIRWVRPDFMTRDRVGPLPMGQAPITICLYESRYGSRILYGRDVVHSGPTVDPCQIQLGSAVTLVLNRMAESLYYIPRASYTGHDELEMFYWASKTILACAESLLLLWGQYHFSYQERGSRFTAMADDRLLFMHDQGARMFDLVARATEFKLRPRHGLYPDTVEETWLQVIPICGVVFQHLVEQVLGFSFDGYSEFPERYLRHASATSRSLSPLRFLILRSMDVYKYLRRRRLPRGLLLPYGVSRVVYAVVPLMFMGWASTSEELRTLLSEARRYLSAICPLEPHEPDPRSEWGTLQQTLLGAWKVFCY
jgi:hypothetical protein